MVTSKPLYEKKRKFNPNTILIPHGVDFDHFSRAASPDTVVPTDIGRISKPIIGFYGLIQDLIDFDLITYIAEKRPDWSIVMIGPTIFDVGDLPSLRNIHFLGPRKREDLPNYVKAFDVCIIPYKLVERKIYASPLKLRQYMASSKPVVSTALPEVMNYTHLVKIANSREEYLSHIAFLLAEDTAEDAKQRMNAARAESWEHIMKRIEQVL